MATSPEVVVQWKESSVGGVQIGSLGTGGLACSYWQMDGNPGSGAVPPTSWTNPDNTTGGGILQDVPGAGKQKWLDSLVIPGPRISSVLSLWDRLGHMSGFSSNVTSPQNVNGGSPATLSRHYTDVVGNIDIGNRIFVEIYTQLGATGEPFAVSYVNQAGVTHTTKSITLGGTGGREILRWIECPLAQGDTGVQALISCTMGGLTGTAGNFGLVVAHSLLDFATGANIPDSWSGLNDPAGMIDVTTACLCWSAQPNATIPAGAIPMMPGAIFSFVDK